MRIGGELDATTVPELEPTLARILDRDPWQVEVELSQLRLIDTVGLGALLRFSKSLHTAGCVFAVSGLRDQPLVVFQLLGLDRRFGNLDSETGWS